MQDKIDKISSLIDKYLKEELNEVERQELNVWLSESDRNRMWFEQITNKEIITQKLIEYAGANRDSVWQKTMARINADGDNVISIAPARTWWKRYGIAAAAAVVVLAVGGWFYLSQSKSTESSGTPVVAKQLKGKVVPGSDKAILTLDDNSTIILENAPDGMVSQQGTTTVSKANGQLNYTKGVVGAAEKVVYNKITTPKGGQYRVLLPDGSKVWLNAASSLRFPIVFAGNERLVQLTGEAYFEVEHAEIAGQRMPFKVDILQDDKQQGKVEVMGTHFNIMAYRDEASIQTTLAEGSVKVNSSNTNGQDKILKPGQQAKIQNGSISVQKVNMEAMLAWKNGHFQPEDKETLIRQIARWYDLDVKYEGKLDNEGFKKGTTLPRDMQFDNLLAVLKAIKINAKLEGNTLVIM